MWMEFFHWFPSFGITNVMIGLIVLLVGYSVWSLLNRDLAHIPGPRCLPLLGMVGLFFSKDFWTKDMENIKLYGKVFRVYEGRKPSLVVADAEILKQILIRNFDDFTDRTVLPINEIFDLILFFSKGARWRRLRYLMTPPFTKGRTKKMWGSIQTCVERLNRNVDRNVGIQEGFNVLELCFAYSMDAVYSSVLGVDIDTLNDTGHPVLTSSKQIFRDSQPTRAMLVLYAISPIVFKILSVFGIRTVNTRNYNVLKEYVEKVIAARKSSPEKHEDLLQMLIDAETLTLDEESKEGLKGLTSLSEEGELKGLTSKELLAQVINLVLAGYDTTGKAMAYFLYCMAKNQIVQESLYEEIKDVIDCDDQLTYESISKMTYLEQCIQETLRLYPIVPRVDRVARRDVCIKGVFIPRDTVVQVPLHALQHDADVWPEPYKFDPERFSQSSRLNRDHFYNNIPFGKGPRHCIGQRLALLEMKMAVVNLLRSYRFSSTQMVLNVDPNAYDISKHGLRIKVDRR